MVDIEYIKEMLERAIYQMEDTDYNEAYVTLTDLLEEVECDS